MSGSKWGRGPGVETKCTSKCCVMSASRRGGGGCTENQHLNLAVPSPAFSASLPDEPSGRLTWMEDVVASLFFASGCISGGRETGRVED